MLLADEDWLRVDKIKDGLRKILIWSDFLREMFGLYCFVLVDIHWQIVVIDPLLRHTFQLAGDWVFGDFDTRHGH